MAMPAAFWGGAALAQFDAPMLCTGPMRFYNADGSFSTYSIRITLDGPVYRIQATDEADGESIDDRGTCGDYLDGACRHRVSDAGEEPEMYYDFSLAARGGDRYLYSEHWSDGFSGNTLLTCRPQSGN